MADEVSGRSRKGGRSVVSAVRLESILKRPDRKERVEHWYNRPRRYDHPVIAGTPALTLNFEHNTTRRHMIEKTSMLWKLGDQTLVSHVRYANERTSSCDRWNSS